MSIDISGKIKPYLSSLMRWTIVILFVSAGIVQLRSTFSLGWYEPDWWRFVFPMLLILGSVMLGLRQKWAVLVFPVLLIWHVYLGFELPFAFAYALVDVAAIRISFTDWK